MGNIDQLLCTHCTYETSFLHQNKTHLKDQVFEYSARAGSVERALSHDLFRRIEPFLNYRLPTDAPHTALIENDARSLPKRLVFLPSANGMCVVFQASYRRYDVTKKRAGSYFAHVLLEMTSDTRRGPGGRPLPPPPPPPPNAKVDLKPKAEKIDWSARDAAQMWGWPLWIEEDDTDPNSKAFSRAADRFLKLPTPDARPDTWGARQSSERVGDDALTAFLRADAEHQPSWVDVRWNKIPAKSRQQLLAELLNGFLTLNVNARECLLIGIEPALAALLFFGVARLLPRRGPAEQLSFSTCEPQNVRPPFALAATYSFSGNFKLADDPRICTQALNTFHTFEPGWEKTQTVRRKDLTQASYAKAIVNLYVEKGPSAVERFLEPLDDEAKFPQPVSVAELADLLGAEAYGQWVIGSGISHTVPTVPTSQSGKRLVASIVRAEMSNLLADQLQNPACWQPLLRILAEIDQSPGNAANPAEVSQRKRLVSDLLSQVRNRQAEAESCLMLSAGLPSEWQVQLVVQLIQENKPLPAAVDDFWKGRFADASSGRQKWLPMIADRLITQDDAAGLKLLLQRYEQRYASLVKVQTNVTTNDALAQSRASILQLLCEVAKNSPTVGAPIYLRQFVNQFVEKNSRWHDELLDRRHWTPELTDALLEVYVQSFDVGGQQPVATSPLGVCILRDLHSFPCLPQGTRAPADIDSWLTFLENADGTMQLRQGKQIAAWKHLRRRLNDLAVHWSNKPTGLKARFGNSEWDIYLDSIGPDICDKLHIATTFAHVTDAKIYSRWLRLQAMQKLVNSAFEWRTNSNDVTEFKFAKEVSKSLDEPLLWNPQWNKKRRQHGPDLGSINFKIVGPVIAAGIVLMTSIWGAISWNSSDEGTVKKNSDGNQKVAAINTATTGTQEREISSPMPPKQQAHTSTTTPPKQQAGTDTSTATMREQETKVEESATPAAQLKWTTKTNEELKPIAKKLWERLSMDIEQLSLDQRYDKNQVEAWLKATLKDHWKASPATILRHIVSPHGTLAMRRKNIALSRKEWLDGDNSKRLDLLVKIFDLLMTDKDPIFLQTVGLTFADHEGIFVFETDEHQVLLSNVWVSKNNEWLIENLPQGEEVESLTTVENRHKLGKMLLEHLSNSVSKYVVPSASGADEQSKDVEIYKEFQRHAAQYYIKTLLDYEESRLDLFAKTRPTTHEKLRPRFINPFQHKGELFGIQLDHTLIALNLHGLDVIRDDAKREKPVIDVGDISWRPAVELTKLNPKDWWKTTDGRLFLRGGSDSKPLLDVRLSPVGETTITIEIPTSEQAMWCIKHMQFLVLECLVVDKGGNPRSDWSVFYDGKPQTIGIKDVRDAETQATSLILGNKSWDVKYSGTGYIKKLSSPEFWPFPVNPETTVGSPPNNWWELKSIFSKIVDMDDAQQLESARLVFPLGVPTLQVKSTVEESAKTEKTGLEELKRRLDAANKKIKNFNYEFSADWFSKFKNVIKEHSIQGVDEIKPMSVSQTHGDLSGGANTHQRATKAVSDSMKQVTTRLEDVNEVLDGKKRPLLATRIDNLQMSVSFDFCRKVHDADVLSVDASFLVPIWDLTDVKGR